MLRYVFFFMFCAIILFANPAPAKQPGDKIDALERQIAAIQKTYLTNNQETASAVAQINSFRDEFGAIKGEVESATHQLKTQHEEVTRLISDIQERLQAIEDRMGLFSSQMTGGTGKELSSAGSEAELFQKALDDANASKYLDAASEFESFIQKYPKSRFVPKARFWIGECFYSTRDYKRAIKEYQNFIERNPRDPKTPEAIFKQGNSFYELGLADEARAFYEKVATAYPASREAAQAKAKLSKIPALPANAKKAAEVKKPAIPQKEF